MIKKRILDIGAGANPDRRATDAIDYWSKKEIDNERRKFYNLQYEGKLRRDKLKLSYPKLNNKIKMIYNTDFTKDILPYHDDSIDVIVSYHSLHVFGNLHTIKEIYRILKYGGHIDIGWYTIRNLDEKDMYIDNKRIQKIIKKLLIIGFKNIKVFKNSKNNTLYSYQFKNDFLTIVRAYK